MQVSPGARPALWLAISMSGAAGLTWEVLWQQQASLSLGASAFGTGSSAIAMSGSTPQVTG